ncbi:MAG: SapC family protein [Desulfosalsimonadaceae bacterium]
MNTIGPLSPERHTGKCWKRFTSYDFSAKTQLAPLTAAELLKSVHAMPLCFARKDTRFYLAGLLAPKPGKNWFVGPDGRWLGGYVPACFRSHPFSLSKIEDFDKPILCVNESSGLISDTEGEPLFNPDGQLSNAVSQVLVFLQEVERNKAITQTGVDALAEAGVIAPWPIKIKAGATEMAVAGVYRIDEAKFAGLNDAVFLGLRKGQALPIAWAQLFSMGNVGVLSHLAKMRQPKKAPAAQGISGIWGDDDMFRF